MSHPLTDAAFLESLRRQSDPPADAVVEAWIASGAVPDGASAVAALGRDDCTSTDPALRAWMTSLDGMPQWADAAKIERGRQIFEQLGPEIGIGLFCGSLPAAYAGRNGVQVLRRTKRLYSDTHRRVMETGWFLLRVLGRPGIDPGAEGWLAIRRVRLIHAAVRRLVVGPVDGLGPWDDAWGVPVNQADLVGTLWTFSLTNLDVLHRSGIRLSADDEEAWVHMWCVIGELMGITPGLLPVSLADATASFDEIRRTEYGGSAAGVEMTQALLGCMQSLLPARFLRGMPAAAIRTYVGPDVARELAVPRADWTRGLLAGAARLNALSYRWEQEWAPMRWLSRRVGLAVWQAFLEAETSGPRPFAVPVSTAQVVEGWGVDLGNVRVAPA
jgi:hypothetical protein